MKSFTFNSKSSESFGLGVKSSNRPILPEANDVYLQNCGYQGNFLHHAGLQDRFVEIACGLKATSVLSMRELAYQISAWLFTAEKQLLTFDDEPDKYYVGKPSGAIDFESFLHTGQFTVRFRCDPLRLGAEQTLSFTNSSLSLTNPGTFVSYPVFNLTFTATASDIRVQKGDDYVRIVHNFAIGDEVYINCGTGAVYVNDVRALIMLDWQNSEFFPIVPGANQIGIVDTGKCTATMTYRPNYV